MVRFSYTFIYRAICGVESKYTCNVCTNTAYEYRVTNSKITFSEKKQKQRAAWTKHTGNNETQSNLSYEQVLVWTCLSGSSFWFGIGLRVSVSLLLHVYSFSQVNEMKFFGSFSLCFSLYWLVCVCCVYMRHWELILVLFPNVSSSLALILKGIFTGKNYENK